MLRSFLSLLALTATATALVSPSGKAQNAVNHNLQREATTRTSRREVFANVAKGMGAAAIALGTSTVSPQASFAAAAPEMGVKAPSFELPNSRGEGNTKLSDLTKTGKWTVLYFYPGAFTSGCTLEARYFQRDMDQYRKLNAQIVGVSVDPVEKNASFCSSENLDFFMLSDQGGKVSKAYGSALSIPGFGTFSNRQTYLIDPKGDLRWIFSDVESHIPRHSEEVLAKLADLTSSSTA